MKRPRKPPSRAFLAAVGVAAILLRNRPTSPISDERLKQPVQSAPEPRARRRGFRIALRAFFGLFAVAVIAAPWAIPGFATAIGGWLAPPAHGPALVIAPPSIAPSTSSAPTLDGPLSAAGPPLRVSVPRLHVDSAVLPISGADGSLQPPSDPNKIGWWKEGPEAGAGAGSTLLAGHTVHTGGGAFDHLDQLVPGDLFQLTTSAGTIPYRVTAVQSYTKGDLAVVAGQVFTTSGPPQALLVTCSNWNGKVFLDNVVVTGVPIAPASPSPSASPSGSPSPSRSPLLSKSPAPSRSPSPSPAPAPSAFVVQA